MRGGWPDHLWLVSPCIVVRWISRDQMTNPVEPPPDYVVSVVGVPACTRDNALWLGTERESDVEAQGVLVGRGWRRLGQPIFAARLCEGPEKSPFEAQPAGRSGVQAARVGDYGVGVRYMNPASRDEVFVPVVARNVAPDIADLLLVARSRREECLSWEGRHKVWFNQHPQVDRWAACIANDLLQRFLPWPHPFLDRRVARPFVAGGPTIRATTIDGLWRRWSWWVPRSPTKTTTIPVKAPGWSWHGRLGTTTPTCHDHRRALAAMVVVDTPDHRKTTTGQAPGWSWHVDGRPDHTNPDRFHAPGCPGGGSHSNSPSRRPIHHRTLDHLQSSGRVTRPRSTGF